MWDASDEYSTGHGRRGTAVVIINETFRGHKGRTGSQLDADNLCRTFSLLGFEVRLITDCTLRDLKHALETGQNQADNCIVCIRVATFVSFFFFFYQFGYFILFFCVYIWYTCFFCFVLLSFPHLGSLPGKLTRNY